MTDNKKIDEIRIQDIVSDNYENIRYNVWYSSQYQDQWFSSMADLVDNPQNILDNGCGTGHLSEFLPSSEIVGSDISSGMLKKAKSRLSDVIRSDSEKLPYKNESFQVIFTRSLLHHLQNPEVGVREMHRILKPGGEVILAEPIETILTRLPRLLVNDESHFSELHKDFNQNQLHDLLSPYFKIVTEKNFGYIAYPLLGFPDVVDPFKYIPFKKFTYPFFVNIDRFIAKIPLVRRYSWGVIIKAIKT